MRRFPRQRLELRPSLALLAALMAEGALKGFASSEAGPMRREIVALYVAGWASAWLSYPVAKLFVAAAPPIAGRWARFAAHHLAGYAACAGLCLVASRTLRAVLTAALGLTLPPPTWLADYLGSVHLHTTFYAGLVFALSAAAIANERDRLALRAAELDAELAAQRVESVVSLVDPEQLAGTLRAIKRRLCEDVRGAERLTQRLADLLRDALSTADPCWTLEREREHLERFLVIAQARLDRAVHLDWSVPGDLGPRHVHRFVLRDAVSGLLSIGSPDSPLHVLVSARGERIVVSSGGIEHGARLAAPEALTA